MRATARRLIASEQGIAALEFVFLAPVLLALAFATVIYSIYFAALMGVREAAAEGARAAVAGLSTAERVQLATDRAQAVIDTYGPLLNRATPVVTTAAQGSNGFIVTVSYNLVGNPLLDYGSFVPLPSSELKATVTVTNGSY